MEHESESLQYLKYLQKYLEGDLNSFILQCEKIEQKEKELEKESMDENNFASTHTVTVFPGKEKDTTYEKFLFRSTIPHTLTLFATIDILGFLTRNGNDFTSTMNNFNSFFCDLKKTIDSLEVTVLRKIYRHGITHTYFPKLNMAIAYRSKYPEDKMFLMENDELILNVKYLKKIVVERLDEIIKDKSLYINMEKQYKILIKDYENKCRIDINELKNRL